jgi:hypothetical protein
MSALPTPTIAQRVARAALSLALALGLCSTAGAQDNPFFGAWQGSAVVNGTQVNTRLVVQPDGRYIEQIQMGPYLTMNRGRIALLGQGIARFSVEDYEPKEQCLPPPGGCKRILPPPGSTYRYRFTSQHTMTLRDARLGGEIRYQRVQ